MAALSFISCPPRLPLSFPSSRRLLRPFSFSVALCHLLRPIDNPRPRSLRAPILAAAASASASSFDGFGSEPKPSGSPSRKSALLNLVQEIEPLDVSLIQKDVPVTTVDAMKRTISGMLGLLPSAQFQVVIEALWEPLSKLLVSSMMTGYTLRNAEFRFYLERNLDIYDGAGGKQNFKNAKFDVWEMLLDNADIVNFMEKNDSSSKSKKNPDHPCESIGIQGLGEMTPETQQYILDLQSNLSSVKEELCEVKRKNAALQMKQFAGEGKNDLLDYLRSLQPEKVVELSEPACSELKETIHSVVHGLLAALSPKMHSSSPFPENSTGTVNIGREDCAELVENTALPYQPLISLTRDYLARLLFWCMLLGHYLRGLEYRMELVELLSLSND